jgi:predicted extracellular nuclease
MTTVLRFLALAATASAISIAEINGPKFLSTFNGQTVANVSGIVTAKGPDGLWLRSTSPDGDDRTSESVYVFGRTFGANLTVGDGIVIGGRVTEYRTNKDYLYLTEIDRPTLTRKISSGNKVEALVIGKDTHDPPTEQYSSLDGGDVFAVPNNKTLVSVANPALEPSRYGLDFWESLSGELVTVQKPIALTKPNNFGDTWIAGNWKLTGKNDRDGLTITDKDANPEAIIIGSPLDGTKNPAGTKMGDEVEEITGVVSYAFGFYRILPRTAIKVTKSQKPTLPKPTKLESKGRCEGITIGAYNVENLAANSSHHPLLAGHIVDYLRSPDIIFVQEVQDDNGPTNDAGESIANIGRKFTCYIEGMPVLHQLTRRLPGVNACLCPC